MSFLQFMDQELSFKGLDGKTYVVSPLSLMEWGKFVTWVLWKPYRDALVAELPEEDIKRIKERCESGKVIELVPPKEWREEEAKLAKEDDYEPRTYEGELVEEEFDINLASSCVRNEMLTLEGLGKQLQIALEINHPELRGKALGKIVNLEKYSELQKAWEKSNGLIDENAGTEEDTEKN